MPASIAAAGRACPPAKTPSKQQRSSFAPTRETLPSAILRKECRGTGNARSGPGVVGGSLYTLSILCLYSQPSVKYLKRCAHLEHWRSVQMYWRSMCAAVESRQSSNRLEHTITTMGRKGETTKFEGAKAAPSEAAKKERERK